jgi:hypothetical protein
MSTEVEANAFLVRAAIVVGRIRYRDGYQFHVDHDRGRVYVELWHWRPDAVTGEMGWGSGGKRFLQPTMTDSDIVRTCLGAALSYEEHEVREFFTYKGARIYGPHLDVEALVEIADRVDFR